MKMLLTILSLLKMMNIMMQLKDLLPRLLLFKVLPLVHLMCRMSTLLKEMHPPLHTSLVWSWLLILTLTIWVSMHVCQIILK
ncbi:hypothetical protein Hanom_Chr16g01503531 [Helianthus anomalus]